MGLIDKEQLLMKAFKKLFSSLNQRGVVHLIPLLLILAGIIGGLVLVTSDNPLKYFSKAGGGSIQFIESADKTSSCVTVISGTQVTTCPKVQFRLNSPLDN